MNNLNITINSKYLYGLVIGITMFHIIIILLYVLIDVKPTEIENENFKYTQCDYSKVKLMR